VSRRQRDIFIGVVLALVAALFRLPRLGDPGEEIFDEVYHAKTALQYLQGQPPVEWVHPPTAKLLIAVPVWLFGYNAWAWRLAPALAGIALAPVFYAFARRVLPTERAAVLASVLLLCDGVYLVQSRTAMTNIFAVLFQVGAALFVVHSALKERLPAGGMTAAGLFLGLALSTRWTSLWAWGFLAVILVALRQWRLLSVREIALSALAFVLLPLVLYTLSYMPLMLQRHQLHTVADYVDTAKDLVQEQKNVWGYHANLRAEHPYFTNWYTWPWLYRPTWYYFNQSEQPLDDLSGLHRETLRTLAGLAPTARTMTWVRGIVAIGNPALWWLSLPVAIWALAAGLAVRSRTGILTSLAILTAGCLWLWLRWNLAVGIVPTLGICAAAFVVAALSVRLVEPRLVFFGLGFLALFLPWGISPRTLNYNHYLFEAIPYACLALGYLLDRHWDGRYRVAARGYVVLVVVMLAFFLPFLVALPVPASWYYKYLWDGGPRPWTWFPTWV
jgi:dolichyl-phosphate-mannose-protein mannosyltransferase